MYHAADRQHGLLWMFHKANGAYGHAADELAVPARGVGTDAGCRYDVARSARSARLGHQRTF